MVIMSTSGWLDRYIAAREASLESVTDLDRAGQGVVMAARATEARWTAYDPSLSRVANANSRFRAA